MVLKIKFASSNENKIKEATKILKNYDIEIEPLIVECPELQSDDIEKVARFSAKHAIIECKSPVFVEDSGLFINALGGFPGPYSSYVYKTIKNEGILKLMENKNDRGAIFKSVIAFCESKGSIFTFMGQTLGKISFEILQGKSAGWGFDPIFIPEGGANKTYAEMGIEQKNMISHRRRSLEKFGNWIKKNRIQKKL